MEKTIFKTLKMDKNASRDIQVCKPSEQKRGSIMIFEQTSGADGRGKHRTSCKGKQHLVLILWH